MSSAVLDRPTTAPAPARRKAPVALRVGFIPLVDCASLIVAQEYGFAATEGIALDLQRETSWANIRDRLALGHFDAAHMLAPMPIAANLGLGQWAVPMVAPLVLNLGGNAVTLSRSLWEALWLGIDSAESGAPAPAAIGGRAAILGAALAAHVASRAEAGERPLTFGMVFPFSGHNYELRDWLAGSGIDPDHDVRLVVVPPPLMVDALTGGQLDGFCVGAPWNDIAVTAGVGRIAVTKAELWPRSPEMVLALRRAYLDANPDRTDALVRALTSAAGFIAEPRHHEAIATLLAEPRFVGAPRNSIARALGGRVCTGGGCGRGQSGDRGVPDYLVFDPAAGRPDPAFARRLYGEMVRWGQAGASDANVAAAVATFRPDVFDRAMAGRSAA